MTDHRNVWISDCKQYVCRTRPSELLEMPADWDCVAWKARGGYGSEGDGESTNGRDNARKERIWFSPGCQRELDRHPLFDKPKLRQGELI